MFKQVVVLACVAALATANPVVPRQVFSSDDAAAADNSALSATECLGTQGCYKTCKVQVPAPYNSAYGCPNKCQLTCNAATYTAPSGSYVNTVTTPTYCNGVPYYYSSYYNFQNQLQYGYIASQYLNCNIPPPPASPALAAADSLVGEAPNPAPQE